MFKTTIRNSESVYTSVVEAKNQVDAALKAVTSCFGYNSLFVTSGEQPICGWVGPVYRLPVGSGKISEMTIVKVMKMKKVEEAAVVGYVGKKFFDEEMVSVGITPTKEARIEYRLKEATWLRNTVFSNIKEVYIRRWFDRSFGNSYYSLRLVSYLDNTKYELHIPQRYGYGDSHSLLRQAEIAPSDCIVREWLEHNGITVVDEGYMLKSKQYKSAI